MAYVCARPKPRHFSDGLEQRPSRGHGQVSVHADVSWPVTESDVFQGCGCGRVPMWYRALKGIGRGGTSLTVVPGLGCVIVAVVPGFACANGFCAKAGLRPRIATPVNNAAAKSGLRNIMVLYLDHEQGALALTCNLGIGRSAHTRKLAKLQRFNGRATLW